MTDYSGFSPGHLKHIELLQAVIARLAGNSFLVKGWTLTVIGLILGFSVERDSGLLAAVAGIPLLGF